MREQWADDIRARARAYWTPERLHGVLGDKNLLLPPTEAPELLRALGLMERDGAIPPHRMKKYRQTNHLLSVLVPSLRELSERFETVHLLDAGCGRSYLTVLVAWWFEHVADHPLDLLGVDRDPTVIESSRRRAAAAGVRGVRFEIADLDHFDPAEHFPELHGVLALHACDTATDDAIALAVRHDAAFVAVAPCCQGELSAAWAARAEAEPDHPLAALWTSPHLRRTAAATLTDSYRQLLLEAMGYHALATEFVEAFHTPKNTLIRAMRRSNGDPEAAARYATLRDQMGGAPITLERLLADRLPR